MVDIDLGRGSGHHPFSRSSLHSAKTSCTGRSEKLNRTASDVARCRCRCQLGTTNRSRGFHLMVVSPMMVSPVPSTTEYIVPSVDRYGAVAKPPGSSAMNAAIVGIGDPRLLDRCSAVCSH